MADIREHCIGTSTVGASLPMKFCSTSPASWVSLPETQTCQSLRHVGVGDQLLVEIAHAASVEMQESLLDPTTLIESILMFWS